MVEDEGDSDSGILVIDHDEEPKEAGFNEKKELMKEANKIVTNEDKDIELKQHNKHHSFLSASKSDDLNIRCTVNEDAKAKEIKGDDRVSTQMECEYKYVHKLKKCQIRNTNSSDVGSIHHSHDNRYPDPETSPRVLNKSNRANMDVDILERGVARRRIEENQTEERRYTTDDIRTLNTNTYRPSITHAYGHTVAPNMDYEIQEPDAFKARNNANRQEEALNIEDCRYDTMHEKTFNHTLRTEHDMYMGEYRYAKINSKIYSHDNILDYPRSINHRHEMNRYSYGQAHRPDDPLSRYTHNHTNRPEHFINMDDSRHITFNINAMHDYRPDHVVNIDDYYTTMYKNVITSTHGLDSVLAIDDFNQAIMTRPAYDVYRRQVALDPFRLQSEVAPSHGPSIIVGTGRLGSQLSRNENYPEVSDVFIHSSQVTLNHPLRFDRSGGDVNIGSEETALNLVCKKKQAPCNVSQESTETIVSYNKKYRIHTSIINQNKPNYEQSSTIADTTYTYKKNNKSKDTVQMNVCESSISVKINKTNNVSDHSSDAGTLDSKVCTNTEKCEVRYNDINIKENTTVDETSCEDNALAHEINDLARDTNIKFLIVFFTRVTELVKETFPEFAKSLQKEIDTLGAVSVDGKVKTDIQYICPLYCSVSTYTVPCFQNKSDDNKIEKHVNRVNICDVCSCIQNCYKIYKKKYYDLLLRHLNERAKEKEENTKSVNKPVRVCKNKPENISRSGTETDGNTAKEEVINKESLTNLEVSNIEQGKGVSLSAHENICKGVANKINDKMFKLKVEKSIFEELSKLTFNLPTNNITNTPAAPMIPSSSNNEREETSTNNSVNNVNQATPKSQQLLNVTKNDCDVNRNTAKNEPKLIFALSPDEISNADIIASKLKNKIYRRPDSVFTCHICTCMFTYYTSFVSHLQKEHNISDIDEEIPEGCIARKCQFCGYYSKQKYHNDHVRRSHPEIFAHKIKTRKIKTQKKVDKRKKSNKRKFVFICLVCNESLMSYEVNVHREANHKEMNIPKMFTKRLLL